MEERDVRARTQLGLTTPIEKAPADDLPPPDFDKWWRENWDSHFTKEFVWRAFNDGALAARAERDEANNELAREIVRQAGLLAERDAKVERLRGALEKISAIRDDIVGRQTIN